METANVVVKPLHPFGAEITGIDLSHEVTADTKAQLVRAFHQHLFLVFHDQTLTVEDHLRATAIFGKVSTQGEGEASLNVNGVNFISSLKPGGSRGKLNDKDEVDHYSVGELRFHSGQSWYEKPLKGVTLYALELPAPGNGGDTLFADSRLLYKLLPEKLRRKIPALMIRNERGSAFADHPLVQAHPDTGETFLYLDPRNAPSIPSLSRKESDELIRELSSYLEEQPEIVYRHVWQLKDLVVWDNLCAPHARTYYDPELRRRLRRTQFE